MNLLNGLSNSRMSRQSMVVIRLEDIEAEIVGIWNIDETTAAKKIIVGNGVRVCWINFRSSAETF